MPPRRPSPPGRPVVGAGSRQATPHELLAELYLSGGYTPLSAELIALIDTLLDEDGYRYRVVIGRLLTILWARRKEIGQEQILRRLHLAGLVEARPATPETLRLRTQPMYSLSGPKADPPPEPVRFTLA